MDPETIKDLVLNVPYPVVLKDLAIDWSCREKTLAEFLDDFPSGMKLLQFEIAPLEHGDCPQFERFRKTVPLFLDDFLEESLKAHSSKEWIAFSYVPIRDVLPGSFDKNMTMGFAGFPEISDEIYMWLCSPGSHTSCHYDTYGRNVVVQAFGRTRWLLFHPDTPNMRPTRIPFEESSVYSQRTFFSPMNPKQNDDLKDQALVVDLGPGDVLIVPNQWWHYAEALDNSLSFIAWIPTEEDPIARIDEYLVQFHFQGIYSTEDAATRALLFNPNTQITPFPDGFLERLLEDVRKDDSSPGAKKWRLEYATNYLRNAQLEDILLNHPKIVSKLVPQPEQFQHFMITNSQRFCEKYDRILKSELGKPRIRTLATLLNSLCDPSTIATARKALLNSQ